MHDYAHVEDLIDAHILALEELKPGTCSVYNLGSEKGFSVLEVLKACEKVTARKIWMEAQVSRFREHHFACLELAQEATAQLIRFAHMPKMT